MIGLQVNFVGKLIQQLPVLVRGVEPFPVIGP
jgi:hypothetical protein